MNGGQPAIGGYLIQTLIALLDALDKDRSWDYVRLEPADPDLEKIDLLWEQATGTRAVQVKSSQNQIGRAAAERWAGELQTPLALRLNRCGRRVPQCVPRGLLVWL